MLMAGPRGSKSFDHCILDYFQRLLTGMPQEATGSSIKVWRQKSHDKEDLRCSGRKGKLLILNTSMIRRRFRRTQYWWWKIFYSDVEGLYRKMLGKTFISKTTNAFQNEWGIFEQESPWEKLTEKCGSQYPDRTCPFEGHCTNHQIKAAMINGLLESGITDEQVALRPGHEDSNSLKHYHSQSTLMKKKQTVALLETLEKIDEPETKSNAEIIEQVPNKSIVL